jgi:uncharacterized protein (DUF1330 family)
MAKTGVIAAMAAVGGMIIGAAVSAGTLALAEESAEPQRPAYLFVRGTVHDREAFREGYARKLPALYGEYGGEYLAVGGEATILEGEDDSRSYAFAVWPSKDAALAFWHSDAYEALRKARIEGGWGDFEVMLVEGLPVPSDTAPLAREEG